MEPPGGCGRGRSTLHNDPFPEWVGRSRRRHGERPRCMLVKRPGAGLLIRMSLVAGVLSASSPWAVPSVAGTRPREARGHRGPLVLTSIPDGVLRLRLQARGRGRNQDGFAAVALDRSALTGRHCGEAEMVLTPLQPGLYGYSVQVEDAAGHRSNIVEASFTVVAQPAGAPLPCSEAAR